MLIDRPSGYPQPKPQPPQRTSKLTIAPGNKDDRAGLNMKNRDGRLQVNFKSILQTTLGLPTSIKHEMYGMSPDSRMVALDLLIEAEALFVTTGLRPEVTPEQIDYNMRLSSSGSYFSDAHFVWCIADPNLRKRFNSLKGKENK